MNPWYQKIHFEFTKAEVVSHKEIDEEKFINDNLDILKHNPIRYFYLAISVIWYVIISIICLIFMFAFYLLFVIFQLFSNILCVLRIINKPIITIDDAENIILANNLSKSYSVKHFKNIIKIDDYSAINSMMIYKNVPNLYKKCINCTCSFNFIRNMWNSEVSNTNLIRDESTILTNKIICIHGAYSTGLFTWSRNLEYFADIANEVHIITLPVFGEKTFGNPDIKNHEIIINSIIRYLDLFNKKSEDNVDRPFNNIASCRDCKNKATDKKWTLVGHSFGTYICIEIAKKRIDLVNNIILVSPVGLLPCLGDSGAFYSLLFKHDIKIKLAKILSVFIYNNQKNYSKKYLNKEDLNSKNQIVKLIYPNMYSAKINHKRSGLTIIERIYELLFLPKIRGGVFRNFININLKGSYINNPNFVEFIHIATKIPILCVLGQKDELPPIHLAKVLNNLVTTYIFPYDHSSQYDLPIEFCSLVADFLKENIQSNDPSEYINNFKRGTIHYDNFLIAVTEIAKLLEMNWLSTWNTFYTRRMVRSLYSIITLYLRNMFS